MKKKISYKIKDKTVEREYNYIPVRYIIAILLTVCEVMAIIGIVVLLCLYVPYFYIAAYATSIGCILKIVASHDNPEYKIPWLLLVLCLPVAGFMLYLMFYSRKLKPKFVRKTERLQTLWYEKDDRRELEALKNESSVALSQAKMLTRMADTHLFEGADIRYFPIGERMLESLLEDLKKAERFIYMEYFIIEEGKFWNSVLDILKEKASAGVDVKVLYDDIGCMSTLPGNYCKVLGKYGISALPFSRLRGNADSEFNNRSHRKITVIDGGIGYVGGINIADEYINERERFGHWKDTAVRIEGEAVYELSRLFLSDFGINAKQIPERPEGLYPKTEAKAKGFCVPFSDGPNPLYKRRVGKSIIQNMLGSALKYVYITSPYLIIDNDLCTSLENAALRGVDVRIILPHIPDKRLVFTMTRSFYPRLLSAGVKIYEYTPGFIHAKTYLADGKYAIVGTMNLDYRSLAHHFENGIWMYGCDCISDIEADIKETLSVSEEIQGDSVKSNIFVRLVRALVRIFAPML